MKKLTYKSAGVDIKKADEFVEKISKSRALICKKAQSKLAAFGSLFDLNKILKKYKNPLLVSSTDGVGTKLLIAKAAGIHHTVGIDLVAMNVNDIVCLGAKPLFFLDYIACGKIELKTLSEVVVGMKKGLKEAQCSLIGGETAEMPGMYKKGDYDLAGFCVGIVDKNKIIDGSKIKKTDLVLGLSSNGLHSNGFSLVRKVLGPKEIKKYVQELLRPTRIYVKPILSLLSAIHHSPLTINGIAHVTGGAFYNKATKILPPGLGMQINKKSWKVPKIFKIIQEKGNITEKEMYSVFNMGIGMIVVVRGKDKEGALKILNRFYKTYRIGEIIESKEKVTFV